MSGRQEKKMRKLVSAGAQRLQQEMTEEMEKRFRELIKPKPKWLPTWIYRRLVHLVINRTQ